MNRIFFALIAIAFVFAAWFQLTWRPPEAEEGAMVTTLTDGRALVVGATGAATFDGAEFKAARSPASIRRHGALVPLPKGGAAVVGGYSAPWTLFRYIGGLFGREDLEFSQTVELWDGRTDRWRAGPPLPEKVASPAVVQLGDSPVLVGGLGPDGPTAAVWRLDPVALLWERLPSLPAPRAGAQAVVLPDGDLVVVGGIEANGTPGIDAFRYDVQTRAWGAVPGPRMSRLRHRLIPNKVGALLVGGENADGNLLPTAEQFEADTLVWTSAGHLVGTTQDDDTTEVRPSRGRLDPAVLGLPDGRVLVAGGEAIATDAGPGVPMSAAEVRGLDGRFARIAPTRFPTVGAWAGMVKGKPTILGGASFGGSTFDPDRNVWVFVPTKSPMEKMSQAMLDRAKDAVMTLVLPLIGGMTLFLGAMKVAEAGGLMLVLARLIRPIMIWLFPDIPPDHPAMGAIILNMAANALGLGNAATPFGLKAMEHLDSLNPHKGTASNSMALFLAINTSSITLLPTGVIVMRAINGSADPGGILVTTLFATICSTSAAYLAIVLFQRLFPSAAAAQAAAGEPSVDLEASPHPNSSDSTTPSEESPGNVEEQKASTEAYPGWISALAIAAIISLVPLALLPWTRPWVEAAIPWIIPVLITGLIGYGFFRGVPVYEQFIVGAKDGWNVAVKIIPFLVAILVAVAMLQSSGALGAFVDLVGPWTSLVGLPGEALPMALLRPLSGSGALGVMLGILSDPAIGPDSYTGYLVSTIQGSTETTFYVLAVYFGAVGIKRYRHTLPAALCADVAGIFASVFICWWMYGG
jgi:spore maturation protein SpmA/spore maturation protein SpmB